MSQMLDQALMKYGTSDMYPFHMPGHKRHNMGISDPYGIDITEVHGFDNLHDPHGMIQEAMDRLAGLYGSRRSYLLINGSTCGNLAAVFTAAGQEDELIIGRNAHKSVYHAAYLRRNRLHYLYPASAAGGQLQGEIRAEDVEMALRKFPESKAVLITSPTYEGIVSDIEKIAGVCHEHGKPLIVDAAHGAHLGFDSYFPQSPVRQGADLVVMSLHKTLPSFTQTAAIHLQGNLIDPGLLERYLRIFQSSSPSYVLMAGITRCIRFLETEGSDAFVQFRERLKKFYEDTSELSALRVWNPGLETVCRDPSKLVIFSGESGYSGEQISARLREEYHLELEMSACTYALAMTSIMDTEQGFLRLADALHKLDASGKPDAEDTKNRMPGQRGLPCQRENNGFGKMMELWEAADAESVWIPLEQSEGYAAAGMVCVYPPGIPILVSGERITREGIGEIQQALLYRLTVQGLQQKEGEIFIKTVSGRK